MVKIEETPVPPSTAPPQTQVPLAQQTQTAVIAPRGSIRCVIIRMVGTTPLVLGMKTVRASEQTFSIKVNQKWLSFVVDPTRAFMVASTGIWLNMRHVQMPYLMYDIDQSVPYYYIDENNQQQQAMVRVAKKMKGELLSSSMLGAIKKSEAYYQGLKAQRNKSGTDLNSMLVVIACVIGIVVGFVLRGFI